MFAAPRQVSITSTTTEGTHIDVDLDAGADDWLFARNLQHHPEQDAVCRGPEIVEGNPKLFVGSPKKMREMEMRSSSFGMGSGWVRIEVVKEFRRGESLFEHVFEHPWGALVKCTHRPCQTLSIGRPVSFDGEVTKVGEGQWWLRASFWVFLRAIGALGLDCAAPRSVDDLRRQCGVVPVKDDGFCGFWCLAHLRGLDLGGAFLWVLRKLMNYRHETFPHDWNKVWEIAFWGLQRWRCCDGEPRRWDKPLFQGEEGVARGNAMIFALQHAQILVERDEFDVNLLREELASMCAKVHQWTPVISVEHNFYGTDCTWLVLAARSKGVVEIEGVDDIEKAGRILQDNGYHLFIANDAESKSVAERCSGLAEETVSIPKDVKLAGEFFAGDLVELIKPTAGLAVGQKGSICGPCPISPKDTLLVRFYKAE